MSDDNDYLCTFEDCTDTFPSTLARELHYAIKHPAPWKQAGWPQGDGK